MDACGALARPSKRASGAPPPARAANIFALRVAAPPAAVADLAVEPGADLWFVVKATEVAIHAAR